MKRLIYTLGVICLVGTTSLAQTNATDTSESSSLQINTRTDSERIEFLMNVAKVYFAEKDFEAAVKAYERVLEIDPKHAEARYVVAHVYINAHQYRKAKNLLQDLIKDHPEDFKLLNNMAWLYATAEDPTFRDGKKAIKLAQEAMTMAPYDHHVWSTLSEAYYVSGNYEKAYRAIKHMAQLATRTKQGLSKEAVEEYNAQIKKCKRAWDTQRILKGEDID